MEKEQSNDKPRLRRIELRELLSSSKPQPHPGLPLRGGALPELVGSVPVRQSIVGFRGLIKAYSWQGESGLQSLDAFDVSDIHWFRIEEVYML